MCRTIRTSPNRNFSSRIRRNCPYAVAFHPKYRENGNFYVFVNDKKQPILHDRVWRYTVDRKPPNKVVPDSKTEIIAWPFERP